VRIRKDTKTTLGGPVGCLAGWLAGRATGAKNVGEKCRMATPRRLHGGVALPQICSVLTQRFFDGEDEVAYGSPFQRKGGKPKHH